MKWDEIAKEKKEMTNGEYYKTAMERTEGVRRFCKMFKNCPDCPIYPRKQPCDCAFVWLELEYKEVELKPCPFCGSKAKLHSNADRHVILCSKEDCHAAFVARSFESEEDAIAAWNKRENG
jgi:Lar family restriction alleviation protein